MIHMMRKWRPMFWWAEGGHISKSIGPFLFKRMREEKVYVTVVEQTPSADKKTRAQSIQGRMTMGMVHFPNFEPRFEATNNERMKFQTGQHEEIGSAPVGTPGSQEQHVCRILLEKK